MVPKINRTLIPIIIILILLTISQTTSTGQTLSTNIYFPLISHNPTGWIGPYGGTFVSLAIDPVNPQIVYAGSYGSGVYKSLDGGETWSLTSQGMANLYVYSLAIDPSNSSIIYAGTYRGKIYKSTNGGQSWSWSSSGIQDQAIVYSIAIDPQSPNIIYAATRGVSTNGSAPWNGVVYKSINSGLNWVPCLENLGGSGVQDWAYSVIVNPHAHKQVLLATHENGPYRSDDYGSESSWNSIDNGIGDFSGRSIVISPQPENANIYYYGVWHVDTIYKSNNAAASWLRVNRGLTYQHVYSVTIDPLNVNNVFLSTFVNGIIKTTDGSASWQSGGLPIDHIYTVAINPETPGQMLAGTSGDGVFRSQDSGITWNHSNTGIENTSVTSTVVYPSNTDAIYASIYGGGVYYSENRGKTWEIINTGLADLFVHYLVMDPAHPGLLYALTDEGGLFKNDVNTTNGWFYASTGLPLTGSVQPAYPSDHPFATLEMKEAFAEQPVATSATPSVHVPLTEMVFAPSNPQVVYLATAGSGVYRSTNGGQSWLPAGLTSQTITSLAVDLINPNLVYAATIISGSILVTTNGGQSWTNIGLPTTFYSLTASPLESGVLYAGTNNGIFRYEPGNWTYLGLSNEVITAIRLNPAQPGLIYAGTENGAYFSLNDGDTWNIANERLNGQIIQSITTDPNNRNLSYLSTMTHGIFFLALHY